MKLHIRAKLGLSPSMTARLPMLFHEYAEDLQNVQVNMVGSKKIACQYYNSSVYEITTTDTTFSNFLADAVPLRWSMWSPCSNNCWKNGEKRPLRKRTQYCDINGVIDTCNENFEECGYPCKFGRLIKR